MRRTAMAWVLVAALGACGDNAVRTPSDAALDGPQEALVDAPLSADARLCEADCNPLSQAGCGLGEKCTFLLPDPRCPGRTVCALDGSGELGEPCTIEPTTDIDDCRAGLLCHDGVSEGTTCSPICSSTFGCEIGTCELIYDVFGVCH